MASSELATIIDRRVKVNLGVKGVYIGELLEVPGSQWHGRVRVTGVVVPAVAATGGMALLRGLRPGEFVVVRADQVSDTTDAGHSTYLSALQAHLNRYVGSHASSVASWVRQAMAAALLAACRSEEHRLATGHWRAVP